MRFLKLNRLLLFFLLILFFIVYALTDISNNFSYVFIVPFFFVIFCWLETKFYNKYTLMSYILYVLSLIKYFIIPIIIIFSNNIKTIGIIVSTLSFKYAIVIMVLEIITLYVTKYIYFKKIKIINKRIHYKKFTNNINIKFILLIIVLILIIAIDRSLLMPKDIFSDVEFSEEIEPKSSFGIVAKWIKLIGLPIVILFFYKLFKDKSYYISFIFFLIFGYIQLSSSRWTILFYTIISFSFLMKIYGNRVKKIIFPISSLLFFLILTISIFKFSWAIKDSDNKYLDIIIVMSDQLQAYFSGPSLIGQTIDLYQNTTYNYKIGVETIINDFMGSIPVISGNFDQKNRINYIFNEYIFGLNTTTTTQIVPMSGIGYIYFGLFGSTILVSIFTYLGLKLENIANNTKDLISYWILLYMAIWCISSIIFSSQLIWGNIIANYAVLFFINMLINKINLKNE